MQGSPALEHVSAGLEFEKGTSRAARKIPPNTLLVGHTLPPAHESSATRVLPPSPANCGTPEQNQVLPKRYLRMCYFVDEISHLTTANGSVLVKNFQMLLGEAPDTARAGVHGR